ncbi:MAG TPA: metalloregulator ArsR/SmtB family transcription factor [Bryobacteraceae bacterium]|nr:metalloregulator ArsR/SmtB family transcription factor [Bryobacteraceae bacterium]
MSPKQIAKIAKALADETRLNIYESIAATDELNCGDICAVQVVGHATVSHHLRILTEAALVDSRRQGQFVFYRALRDTLEDFSKALADLGKVSTASQV